MLDSAESVILIDEANRVVGTGAKLETHTAGLLHRAFSVFLLDSNDRLLIQKRSPLKYHSGSLWANSCCGHPRPGERTAQAAKRRLLEELGIAAPLKFKFFSRYEARLANGMIENELSYVFFGRCDVDPIPNEAEVSDFDFVQYSALRRQLNLEPDKFAEWFRLYFDRHGREIAEHWAMAAA